MSQENLTPIRRRGNSSWDGSIDPCAILADGSTNLVATLTDAVGKTLYRYVRGFHGSRLHRFSPLWDKDGRERENQSWSRMARDWYMSITPPELLNDPFWPPKVAHFDDPRFHPEKLYSLNNLFLQCGDTGKCLYHKAV